MTSRLMTLAAGAGLLALGMTAAEAADRNAVLDTYADVARAGYEDSLRTARGLQQAVEAFLADPDETSLAAAREAWIAARVPYQQTEAYRFGNPAVDEWEGRVNAWPLDEGLIDYVDTGIYGEASDENAFYAANVIANPTLTVGGRTVDAGTIDAGLLSDLHEIDAIEANVAKGYHAIEFLLWGQDLNGTGPGAGNRPASDYDPAACTGGNCDRRAQYLRAATDLLIRDLEEMVANWDEDGAAREAVAAEGAETGLAMAFKGLGSLSYGELAGERMKLGLMLHDPEEEHDCFSDNTHWSHYYDALGIRNVYTGRYQRVDGSVVEGPSLSDLVAAADPAANEELLARLDATQQAMKALVDRARTTEAYDQMIAMGNEEGNRVVLAAVDALTAQTRAIERAGQALGLGAVEFEGSDSLDDPQAVFQ
ncbi:imelysin family protein [Arenibaculum sp.]|uniref:imelysin family protein n=1 Tax=Arenibaculum sp. TaxID=2865862 RepID=UPI002E15FC7A|nr:imelysin family protein [Arenibaculum sp.]